MLQCMGIRKLTDVINEKLGEVRRFRSIRWCTQTKQADASEQVPRRFSDIEGPII